MVLNFQLVKARYIAFPSTTLRSINTNVDTCLLSSQIVKKSKFLD